MHFILNIKGNNVFMLFMSVTETDGAVDGPMQDCVPRMHLLMLQPYSEFSVFGRIRVN
jgi:hypothetical protein